MAENVINGLAYAVVHIYWYHPHIYTGALSSQSTKQDLKSVLINVHDNDL